MQTGDSGIAPAQRPMQRLADRRYRLFASDLFKVIVVAAGYFLAGKAALLLAIPPGYAAAVWPSAGLALAAALLFDYKVLAGVALGSFLVNFGTSFDPSSPSAIARSALLSGSIGLGAALQAALGKALIKRYVGFPTALLRAREVIAFLLLGGPIACLVAATWGVGSLTIAGTIPTGDFAFSWLTWWVGDSIGVLIFCPLALLFLGKPAHLWRPRRLVVALPLCLSFAMAVIVYVAASKWELARCRGDFEHKAEMLGETLQRQFSSDLDVLRSGQGLFSVSANIDRAQFQQFAAVPLSHHPELSGLAWLPYVSDADRAAWESNYRAQGLEGLQITQRDERGTFVRAATRNGYAPICYLEPDKGKRSLLGFDDQSVPDRADAMYRARDTGEPVATRPVRLLVSSGHPWGLIVYAPVYRAGAAHSVVGERRKNLLGYVTTILRFDSVARLSFGQLDGEGIQLAFIDESTPTAPQMLVCEHGVVRAESHGGIGAETSGGFVMDKVFEAAGHRYCLRAVQSNDYLVAHPTWTAWAALVGGLRVTALLGGFLLVLTGRTARIEEMVLERTTELRTTQEQLRRARDAAEAASDAKSSFLANMSHEIRTPLTAVIGYAEQLKKCRSASGPPAQTWAQRSLDPIACVETITRNARHLLELIDDILDLSKIESGNMIVQVSAVDLPELMTEVSQMMRPLAEARGLEIRFAAAGPFPRVIYADRLRLRQVLLNLIGNAIKFTQAGGVKVRLSSSLAKAHGPDLPMEMRFEVSDSGIGMTAEQMGKLFRPFSQADASPTRRFAGTGLGLAISSRLVEMMKGSISVASEVDKGSTFTVVMRAETPADFESIDTLSCAAARVNDEDDGEIVLHGMVLLAEDSTDNQRLVSAILAEAGLQVAVARNGQQAVEQACAQTFDLILLDIQMPLLDGYSAAAQISSVKPDLPIIAFTAHATAQDRARAMAAGCCEYLSKPFNTKTLLKTLAKYLEPSAPGFSTNGDMAFPAVTGRELHRSLLADNPLRREILGEYIDGLPPQVSELAELLKGRRFAELRELVHKIRGTGGLYGFPGVTELASAVEGSLVAGNFEAAKSGAMELIEFLRHIEGYDSRSEGLAA